MLKALGIGKKASKKPASEEQLQKYREQLQTRDMWRKDVENIQGILQKLDQEYSQHKGDFAIARYDKLKNMIKSSIKEYEEVLEVHKGNEKKALNDKVASRYGGDDKTSSAKLKNSAAGFAASSEKDWAMSSKQVEEDTERFRKEVIQLKQDFRTEKSKLDKLAKDYQASKKRDPTARYALLKQMIKDMTRPPG